MWPLSLPGSSPRQHPPKSVLARSGAAVDLNGNKPGGQAYPNLIHRHTILTSGPDYVLHRVLGVNLILRDQKRPIAHVAQVKRSFVSASSVERCVLQKARERLPYPTTTARSLPAPSLPRRKSHQPPKENGYDPQESSRRKRASVFATWKSTYLGGSNVSVSIRTA